MNYDLQKSISEKFNIKLQFYTYDSSHLIGIGGLKFELEKIKESLIEFMAKYDYKMTNIEIYTGENNKVAYNDIIYTFTNI